MPPSRSPRRTPKPPEPIRLLRPIIAIGVVAVVGFVLLVLPASLVARFLPPQILAEDFSGTLWHGSAGKLTVNSRNAGACEWHIHPLALLALALDADIHWVQDFRGGRCQRARGSSWLSCAKHPRQRSHRGIAGFRLCARLAGQCRLQSHPCRRRLSGNSPALAGTVDVNALHSLGIAAGADLGNYQMRLPPDALSRGRRPHGDHRRSGWPAGAAGPGALRTGYPYGTFNRHLEGTPRGERQLARSTPKPDADAGPRCRGPHPHRFGIHPVVTRSGYPPRKTFSLLPSKSRK